MGLIAYLFVSAVVLELLRVGAEMTSPRMPKLRWGFLLLWGAAAGYGSLIVLGVSFIHFIGFSDMTPQLGAWSVVLALVGMTWIAHCVRTIRRILGFGPLVNLRLSERHWKVVRRYWLRTVVGLAFLAFMTWVNWPY